VLSGSSGSVNGRSNLQDDIGIQLTSLALVMGSSQSTRKISISNPEVDGLIKVTENVVDRLRSNTVVADTTSVPVREESQKEGFESTPASTATTTVPDFTSSLQIRREIEGEIKANNYYWESRIRKLQEAHRRINHELSSEYQKALTDVDKYFAKLSVKTDVDSCTDSKQLLVDCYKRNKHRSLLCSKEVQHFNDCVDKRTNVLLQAK